jgi:diketogulonate reductase-like aldo/keto reductase
VRPVVVAPDGVVTTGGLRLPAVGFGTYRLTGHEGRAVMVDALRNGYRLLDSAFSYENEGAVGAAVRDSGVPRESVVVVSKLAGRHHRHDLAVRAVEESVMRTGLDRIDLFLVHWPNPRVDLYVEAWQALVEARDRGLVGHIGVCNFGLAHLDRLVGETGVAPEVNQVELHPFFPQRELVSGHAARGIATMAWVRWAAGPTCSATRPSSPSPPAGASARHRRSWPGTSRAARSPFRRPHRPCGSARTSTSPAYG